MTGGLEFVARCVCGTDVLWTATPRSAAPLCDCTSVPPSDAKVPMASAGDAGRDGTRP